MSIFYFTQSTFNWLVLYKKKKLPFLRGESEITFPSGFVFVGLVFIVDLTRSGRVLETERRKRFKSILFLQAWGEGRIASRDPSYIPRLRVPVRNTHLIINLPIRPRRHGDWTLSTCNNGNNNSNNKNRHAACICLPPYSYYYNIRYVVVLSANPTTMNDRSSVAGSLHAAECVSGIFSIIPAAAAVESPP